MKASEVNLEVYRHKDQASFTLPLILTVAILKQRRMSQMQHILLNSVAFSLFHSSFPLSAAQLLNPNTWSSPAMRVTEVK